MVFSYVALAAQIAYSFISIPLALSHLTTAEFGMWGLVTTVGSFLLLTELGMTESFMRHLFECKDGRDPAKYGRLFTASCLALGLVSLVVLAGGVLVGLFAAPVLQIPPELRQDFTWVMLGASAMAALITATRMLGVPLVLHHRQDLCQIGNLGLFAVKFLSLFLAFKAGWGIYALLAVEVAGALWVLPFNAWMCIRHGYFPEAGTFALPSRGEWTEVRNYSMSNFVIQIGGTVLTGLPQLLISSRVGLDAAGLWTVCTRVFSILKDIAVRPFGIANPMLLDFFVKGEVGRAVNRWVQVSQVVMASAGLFFAVAAANNGRFIELWTGVGSAWGLVMHVSIGAYFLSFVAAGCAYGVIAFSKSFGVFRVVPLLQAAAVAGLSFLFADRFGSVGIILASALGFLLGMLFFGMRQLGLVTRHNALRIFVSAIGRPLLIAPLVFACAYLIGRSTEFLPGYPGLLLSAGSGFLLGLPLMGFLGVSKEVRGDLFGMALKPLRRFLPASPKPAAPAPVEPGPGLDP